MFPIQEISRAVTPNIALFVPAWVSLPNQFKHGTQSWNILARRWCVNSINELHVSPKESVDWEKAEKHIEFLVSDPHIQWWHKESSVAFLLCEWLNWARWKVKGFVEFSRTDNAPDFV